MLATVARVELVDAAGLVVAGPVEDVELALVASEPHPVRARPVTAAEMMARRIRRMARG
jgi:hypothetical protein